MTTITQLSPIEYLEFKKEYNAYLDGEVTETYLGSNPKIRALEQVILAQPNRPDESHQSD
jgi:hypothetical protein